MTNLHSNVPDGERLVDVLDLTEPQNARKINRWSGIIAFLATAVYVILLSNSGHSPYWVLIAVPLLVPTAVLHELLHYIFQCLFSHKKPRIGFKFPFPYSVLAIGARISRNQALFCAFAPLLFVTPLLVLPSLSLDFIPKIVLLALASFHGVASCFGDFWVVYWLLRHQSRLKLGAIGLSNALFENAQDRRLSH